MENKTFIFKTVTEFEEAEVLLYTTVEEEFLYLFVNRILIPHMTEVDSIEKIQKMFKLRDKISRIYKQGNDITASELRLMLVIVNSRIVHCQRAYNELIDAGYSMKVERFMCNHKTLEPVRYHQDTMDMMLSVKEQLQNILFNIPTL